MSQQELQAQNRLHYMTKLYLDESYNDFTLDKIEYGQYKFISTAHRYTRILYPDAIITLKDKYSPMKLHLVGHDIYTWFSWRDDKYLPARYNYLMANNHIRSDRCTDYKYSDKQGRHSSLGHHKQVLNLIK